MATGDEVSMRRRELLKCLALAGATVVASGLEPAAARPASDDARTRLAMLERRHGGRLGVAIRDTGTGRCVAWRGEERFLMCSTFKLLLAAAVLARVDAGRERLARRVVFDSDVLLDYAPISKRHVGPPGMTIARLCQAAITLSDNTAANLLLGAIGGPQEFTAYARSLGDAVTRLDRTEPMLNRSHGDRDTTAPSAMLADLDRLLLGTALSAASRARLVGWLRNCRTGGASLRAGLPPAWRAGDKTGSGDTATNDIAILWPPWRAPLLVSAYYDNPRLPGGERYPVLAAVGRIAATM